MKKINELRAADDNYAGLRDKPATTNFHFLATAEAGAMRGAALMRHSRLTTSCEDLAFGYSDPTVGWYNEEKADFDAIKESLGITKITGLDDIRRIEREAEKRGIVVGHYTNLFWESDQIMGVGYTQYGKRFKNTFCYNAGKTSSYTNDEYGRGRHAYTVGEMEALLDSGRVLLNEPLKDHTSFRIGGPADVFVMPENTSQIRHVIDKAIHKFEIVQIG